MDECLGLLVTEPPRINALSELRSDMRGLVSQWLSSLKMRGVSIRVLETRRTVERQNWIYAQGRTRAGPIVTHVSGSSALARHVAEPGMATALDFCFAGAQPWVGPWELCGSTWEHVGGSRARWGGRWRVRDLGHIELNDQHEVAA